MGAALDGAVDGQLDAPFFEILLKGLERRKGGERILSRGFVRGDVDERHPVCEAVGCIAKSTGPTRPKLVEDCVIILAPTTTEAAQRMRRVSDSRSRVSQAPEMTTELGRRTPSRTAPPASALGPSPRGQTRRPGYSVVPAMGAPSAPATAACTDLRDVFILK